MAKGGAITRLAEDYFVFTRCLDIVIPGRATWREPGIHTLPIVVMDSGLAASRRPGMTGEWMERPYAPNTSFCILPP